MERKSLLPPLGVLAVVALGAAIGALAVATPGAAEGLEVRLEPLFIDALGHDQPVLVVSGGGSAAGTHEATTDSGIGYHLEMRKPRRESRGWGWGVDFFWFTGAQTVADLDVTGDATFMVADRQLMSPSGEQPLYYRLLDDNDINGWTLDVYGLKPMGEREGRRLWLQTGVRAADFDNDYRAALGVGTVGGVRLDSSSNYDRMHGPLVGLIAQYDRGRQGFELAASQSVVFGNVELSGAQSDFDGFFAGDSQVFTAVTSFTRSASESIPITDLQAKWRRELGGSLAVTAGINVSTWFGVTVPPGVIPTAGREVEDENTITFLGLLLGIEF